MGRGGEGVFAAVTAAGVTPISFIVLMTDYDNIGFQLITTGTLAGAWTFQADNKYSNDAQYNWPANPGTWPSVTALFTTVPAVLSGGSDNYAQTIGLGAKAVRATFTPTSGAGTAQAIYCAKGGE